LSPRSLRSIGWKDVPPENKGNSMTDIVVSNARTTTVNLAPGDSLSLIAGGSIVPMSGHGVFGANANALTIEGDIITRSGTGILLGTAGFGVNTLSVLGTGLIMGLNG
jgi:hypothetical protein